ncbi:hypothetical protein [Streptomyces sp. NPDC018833]|uniref:hypothetical protein n=1 Tax=Streptomyces sp. NPDC018833 TaxID=3365053 RepID=UPI00378FE059
MRERRQESWDTSYTGLISVTSSHPATSSAGDIARGSRCMTTAHTTSEPAMTFSCGRRRPIRGASGPPTMPAAPPSEKTGPRDASDMRVSPGGEAASA